MNAGISEKSASGEPRTRNIAGLVKEVTVMDYNGNIKKLERKEIGFGYRRSSLSKYIVLSACLRLNKKKKNLSLKAIKGYMKYRKETQDLTFRSAGCVFKNPAGYSAGRLIDLCGLKGTKMGGARVSLRHANFIINAGQAKASDILKLMALIKRKVKARFNIELKPEITIWQN